jgi:hypothetical protein
MASTRSQFGSLFTPACLLATLLCGCATNKESDTARTGIEQLLISSAVDRSLDKVDLTPITNARVYVETKYLDCVDKNYIIVSVHQRLLQKNCTLVEKSEEAQVVLELGSGGVGTDRHELFVGIPEIPLPPPSPIAIPKLALYTRTKAMGTAKLTVVAYDTTTKRAVINSAAALARSDHKNWNVMGAGSVEGGSLTAEIAQSTGDRNSVLTVPTTVAGTANPLAR